MHEIHAIHAADNEWRMRRQLPIPVTCTTVGPGNFNTIAGIAEAFFDSVPMMCLMAGGATKWYGRGGIQEIYRNGEDKFIDMFKDITKAAVTIVRPDTALASTMRAYKTAITGRPGPVVIYMPLDVQNTEVEVDMPTPDELRQWLVMSPPAPDPAAIDKAIALLAKAERPMIYVSSGIHNARASGRLENVRRGRQDPRGHHASGKGIDLRGAPAVAGRVRALGHGTRRSGGHERGCRAGHRRALQ